MIFFYLDVISIKIFDTDYVIKEVRTIFDIDLSSTLDNVSFILRTKSITINHCQTPQDLNA